MTLKEVPDEELDRIAGLGFDWVWLLSVWQTGEASRALPDLTGDDICGSGFAITGYTASNALGGAAALADIRRRLAKRGLKLMLDHVPNHTGLGHPWIDTHPNYFVRGSEQDLQRQPQNFVRVETRTGPRIFAYGRDPNFGGWPDTLQLDYGNPDLQMRASPNCSISPANATAFAATWRCSFCRRCSDVPGASKWRHSGRARSQAFASNTPASCSSRKCIGTWNGHCSSKGSITVRQAALRSPARRARSAGPRPPGRAARLSG